MRMGDRRQTYAGAGCAQAGGSVVVWKLDRLGRNTLHILATVKLLTERGVTLVSITKGIDSSTEPAAWSSACSPGWGVRARAGQGADSS